MKLIKNQEILTCGFFRPAIAFFGFALPPLLDLPPNRLLDYNGGVSKKRFLL
jgi:hypothetical protein